MIDYDQILSYKNKHELVENKSLEKNIDIINEILCKISNTPIDKNNNWRAEKPTYLKKNEDDVIKIRESDINSSLNKISPLNINETIKYIVDIPLKKNVDIKDYTRLINFTIENLFTKALEQSVYCPLYVSLIENLKPLNDNVSTIIIDKCNKFKYIIKETSSNSYSNSLNKSYEDFCKNLKDKSYKTGYSQFLGELFNNEIVTLDIIDENVQILFNNIEKKILEDPKNQYIEENIICLCKLLLTINSSEYVKSLKPKLENIKMVKALPKRLQFIILDLMDQIK
tara:strand:- start:2148 stop:2999 length:852 start_codon:yes stop_codon:yes gene_type:complete